MDSPILLKEKGTGRPFFPTGDTLAKRIEIKYTLFSVPHRNVALCLHFFSLKITCIERCLVKHTFICRGSKVLMKRIDHTSVYIKVDHH